MIPFFENTRPGRQVTYGQATFDLPILYFRDDFFGLYFSATFKAVKEIMPSHNLHPLMLPNGRAVVAIAAYNYIDTTVGPYGEVAVAIPVVYGKKPGRLSSIPALIKESNYPNFGALVHHLPVTKIIARDAGRGEWGYTKFVADMTFHATPEAFNCTMGEKETHILDLHVPRQGIRMRDKKPLTTYSVREGKLIKTVIKHQGLKRVQLRPQNAFIRWGDHPVSQSVKDLGISEKPFMSMYYVERSAILPEGWVMESNVAPFEGYRGEDREGVHKTFYTRVEK